MVQKGKKTTYADDAETLPEAMFHDRWHHSCGCP